MEDLFSSIVSILIGCALILFRKPFGQSVVRSQNKTWGFHFGDTEATLSEYIAMVVGIAAIGFGVLRLFG